MAIATTGGHVARAIDFLHTTGKYFIIGGSTPWANETAPVSPSPSDYKLIDVIGLKKVDSCYLVRPATTTEAANDNDNSIISTSSDSKWKSVTESIVTTVGTGGITSGSYSVPLSNALSVGLSIRINNMYQGKITAVNGLLATLDKPAPADIPAGSPVIGGAYVEGAKYVYVSCRLSGDTFPLATYRQVGLCTGVVSAIEGDDDVLRSSSVEGVSSNEYSSIGTLEILDNRAPSTRYANTDEVISLVIEF